MRLRASLKKEKKEAPPKLVPVCKAQDKQNVQSLLSLGQQTVLYCLSACLSVCVCLGVTIFSEWHPHTFECSHLNAVCDMKKSSNKNNKLYSFIDVRC